MPIRATNLTDEIAAVLNNGGIGVFKTDTLYGVVARADNEAAVERVYQVKTRTPSKSPIVLIASLDDMFDSLNKAVIEARFPNGWPEKTSIILPSQHAPSWLTRGNDSVAYRIPGNEKLRLFVKKTGPLIAPSANPEGLTPAKTIEEAENYFGDAVDFYVDGGEVTDETPSQLYRFTGEGLVRLR